MGTTESVVEGDAIRRNKRIVYTIGSSAGNQFVLLITPLITTPFLLQYLGAEKFGLWVTATSLLSMFAFADLGLGNGLLTKVSICYGNADHKSAQQYISSAYYLLAIIALCLMVALIVSGPFISWDAVFNTSSTYRDDAYWATMIFFTAFFINIPLGLIQRVQLGIQKGFLTNAWQSAGSLISLAAIIAAVHMRANMAHLIVCACGAMPAASLVNSLFFYRYQRPAYHPSWAGFEIEKAKELFKVGLLFFFVSALTSVSLYSDNMIIAQIFNLEVVAAYAIPAKLSKMLSLMVTVLCIPLWPANSEAISKQDFSWVKKNTMRMFFISTGCILLGVIVFVALGPKIIEVWLNNSSLVVSRFLLSSLGLWTLVLAASAPFLMVLNSIGIVKPQIYAWLFFLPLSIILKLIFAKAFGVAGIPIANVAAYILIVVPMVLHSYNRCISEIRTTP